MVIFVAFVYEVFAANRCVPATVFNVLRNSRNFESVVLSEDFFIIFLHV